MAAAHSTVATCSMALGTSWLTAPPGAWLGPELDATAYARQPARGNRHAQRGRAAGAQPPAPRPARAQRRDSWLGRCPARAEPRGGSREDTSPPPPTARAAQSLV